MAEAAAKRAQYAGPVDARAQRFMAVWNSRANQQKPAEFFPTFATAFAAHCWRLTYCCPACRTMGSADLRDYADAHHPRAPISVLIPKLSCDRCSPNPPLAILIAIECPTAGLPPAPTLPPLRTRHRPAREDLPQERTVDARPDRPRPGANIASCRKLNLTHLVIYCRNIAANCSHDARIPIADLPDDLLLDDIEARTRCQRCGAMKADVRPDYSPITPAPSGGGPPKNSCA